LELPIKLALIITALPLAAFVIQVFFGRFLPRQGDWLPMSAVGAGLAMSTFLLVKHVLFGHFGPAEAMRHGMAPVMWKTNWIAIGESSPLTIDFEVMVDNLTVIMLFVVTLVSFLVHLFSSAYMHGEKRYNRFYAYLALFTFSMLGLVITSNLFLLFVFWELVGACSYFLIGFYFEKPSAAAACKKAFLTNRVGDTFFFLGIMMIGTVVGSFSFPAIFESVRAGQWEPTLLTVAGLCVFAGAVSKSAQFPLHVWLPDAMEGPTPVSALIHAATMVAAGVYMVCRMFPFIAGWDGPDIGSGAAAIMTGNYMDSTALSIIALVGGFTAIFAATIAIAQYDIKKVLAYSTVSQLGYMCMGVGVGSMSAAMFHLFTHAMFKACLFLGSGSVIHAMHHHQDMRDMGGLRRKLPVTYWTFLIATLALCGLPFFSGMISKEAILTQAMAYAHYKGDALAWLPFIMCWITAGLTSFYMFRLVINVFWGQPKNRQLYEHAHESPLPMTIPLLVLAGMSVIGAGLAIPGGPGTGWFEHRSSPEVLVGELMTSESIVPDAVTRAAWADHGQWHDPHADAPRPNATEPVRRFYESHHWAHWPTMLFATGIGLIGIALSLFIFWKNAGREYVKKDGLLDGYKAVLTDLYGIDKFYAAVPIAFTHWLSRVCLAFDKYVVDGIVNAAGVLARVAAWFAGRLDYNGVDGAVRGSGELAFVVGNRVRRIQTGRIQDYLGLTVFGLALVFVLVWMW
jgi:NADH-quinone oxidoreductase subunit L